MEASQAYYLYKIKEASKMPVETRRECNRKIAISWAIESMKTILGYEDIRNIIMKYYFPNIPNCDEMCTFDSFQQYETPPFIDKYLEIIDYCKYVIEHEETNGIVLMTASNIQNSAKDKYTHYQSFIINKDSNIVYAIDPASKEHGIGTYVAAITETVVLPVFHRYGYKCKYVTLTNAAQTNKQDVFCQTWTLIIMIEALEKIFNNELIDDEIVIDIPSPKPKIKKYKILLDFFKKVLINIPELTMELEMEYIKNMSLNRTNIMEYGSFEKIVNIHVKELILSMTAEELMNYGL